MTTNPVLTNPVSGEPKKLSDIESLRDLFDEEVHEKIDQVIDRLKPSHMVVYEVIDFTSSQAGHRQVMAVGPGLSVDTLEKAIEGRLGDVPSRFAYPVYYLELA